MIRKKFTKNKTNILNIFWDKNIFFIFSDSSPQEEPKKYKILINDKKVYRK